MAEKAFAQHEAQAGKWCTDSLLLGTCCVEIAAKLRQSKSSLQKKKSNA